MIKDVEFLLIAFNMFILYSCVGAFEFWIR